MNDRLPPPPLEPEGVEGDDGEASEEDGAGNAQLERGVDGERVFRSGFLFKKQERRKVGSSVGYPPLRLGTQAALTHLSL